MSFALLTVSFVLPPVLTVLRPLVVLSVFRPLLTVSGVMSLEATVPVLLLPFTVSFVLRMEMMLSMEKRGQPSLSTGALQALRTPTWRRGSAGQRELKVVGLCVGVFVRA